MDNIDKLCRMEHHDSLQALIFEFKSILSLSAIQLESNLVLPHGVTTSQSQHIMQTEMTNTNIYISISIKFISF